MISKGPPREAFVWIWLPGAATPVVAGRLDAIGDIFTFTYGKSYLERHNAIPIYLPELPTIHGRQRPLGGLTIAGSIADAGPDSWGRRVILARHTGHLTKESDTGELDELTYFLRSGSDRIGALDFQNSATEYVARGAEKTFTVTELADAADRLIAGEPLPEDLADALIRGTSVGGARPKALLNDDDGASVIAKFSTAADPYPVIKAEGLAMDLARRVGLDVAGSRVEEVAGRDVLMVKRFDRTPNGGRRLMVSALTMLELSELNARAATYVALTDIIRHRFVSPKATLRELFRRIVFNIAVGNTDDHARNHAAFWDGQELTLTPAYDIAPQLRSGNDVTQAMAITRNGDRRARFSTCRAAAGEYLMSEPEADEIIERTKQVIHDEFEDAAEAARLTAFERRALWRRQILNPSIEYTFED